MDETNPALRPGPVDEPRYRAFLEAAPARLRPHAYDAVTWPTGVPRAPEPARLDALWAFLEPGAPGVRAVLRWAGACSGSYRSGPADEALPEALLHHVGTPALLAAVHDDESDAHVLAGLARHLASHELSRAARSMPARVSPALRVRLLEHVRSTRRREDLEVLEHAFEASRPAPTQPHEVACHPDRTLGFVAEAGGRRFAVEPYGLLELTAAGLEPLVEHRPFTATVAVDAAHLYVARFDDGSLRRLDASQRGAGFETLLDGLVRPVSLAVHQGAVAVLEQRYENVPGVVHSVTHTRIIRVGPDRRVVELLARTGSAWDLALVHDTAFCLEARGPRTVVVAVDGVSPPTEVAAFEGLDGAFVRMAGRGGRVVVALPTRRRLRRGIELLQVDASTGTTHSLGFSAGHFEGLSVGPRGVALVVERRGQLRVTAFGFDGRTSEITLPRVAGPLVSPFAAERHVLVAVGPRAYAVPAFE